MEKESFYQKNGKTDSFFDTIENRTDRCHVLYAIVKVKEEETR